MVRLGHVAETKLERGFPTTIGIKNLRDRGEASPQCRSIAREYRPYVRAADGPVSRCCDGCRLLREKSSVSGIAHPLFRTGNWRPIWRWAHCAVRCFAMTTSSRLSYSTADGRECTDGGHSGSLCSAPLHAVRRQPRKGPVHVGAPTRFIGDLG